LIATESLFLKKFINQFNSLAIEIDKKLALSSVHSNRQGQFNLPLDKWGRPFGHDSYFPIWANESFDGKNG